MTYQLTKMGKSKWLCLVQGSPICAIGSRPDLAIRDWKKQRKLREKKWGPDV